MKSKKILNIKIPFLFHNYTNKILSYQVEQQVRLCILTLIKLKILLDKVKNLEYLKFDHTCAMKSVKNSVVEKNAIHPITWHMNNLFSSFGI
jgi:hypothetical protein